MSLTTAFSTAKRALSGELATSAPAHWSVQHLCEQVGVHAVLGAHGEDVALIISAWSTVTFPVSQQRLFISFLNAVSVNAANLGAVLLASWFASALGLLKRCRAGPSITFSGTGISTAQRICEDLVACLRPARQPSFCNPFLMSSFSSPCVELEASWCELVVSCGRSRLDCESLTFDGCLLVACSLPESLV